VPVEGYWSRYPRPHRVSSHVRRLNPTLQPWNETPIGGRPKPEVYVDPDRIEENEERRLDALEERIRIIRERQEARRRAAVFDLVSRRRTR
jgi:hypothetical protein